jgi:hypothetical protein
MSAGSIDALGDADLVVPAQRPDPERSDARRLDLRRTLLAAAVAAAPLLQLAGMVPHPVLPDSPAATLELVAQDPDGWFRMHALAASSAALSIVAGLALAGLVRGRGARLATVGASLQVVGAALLVFAFAAEAHLWSLAADPSLDRAAVVPLVALEHDSPAMTGLGVAFPLLGLGTVLLMSGLLRSGVVPRWQPVLVLVGTATSIAAAPGSSLGPLLFAPSVLGMLALAVSVARAGR